MLQDELYRAQAELVAELEAFGALGVALVDAARWLGAEEEVRTSGIETVLASGARLGVGRVLGGEVGVGVAGVLLVEVAVDDVTGEGGTEVDPPVICVTANAGLVLPESPKTG